MSNQTLKIEYDSEDLKAIENALGIIKSLAMKAWMGTDRECRLCLKDIIFQTNSITSRMLNGELINEVELSR